MPVSRPLGTVSHGTMRSEDLIPAFVDALDGFKDELSMFFHSLRATPEETPELAGALEGTPRYGEYLRRAGHHFLRLGQPGKILLASPLLPAKLTRHLQVCGYPTR